MYSLIVDSSTKVLYVALVNDNNVVYEKYVEGRNDHAKNIVFCIDEALKAGNINTEDLDKVIVGYGPGSYTGVRMAVTVCKMMAVFKNVGLYTISTLALMASGSKGIVRSMIDARRGNAFARVIDTNNKTNVLVEGMYSYDELEKYNSDYVVKEDDYRVDPFYVVENCEKVNEPHLLVPNYLRDTEAERNLS